MRQAFVFVQDELSLRNVVAQVRFILGDEMPNWGRYFCLFLRDGGYACIGLGSLSGELERQPWTLDTHLTTFRYQACAKRLLSGSGQDKYDPACCRKKARRDRHTQCVA